MRNQRNGLKDYNLSRKRKSHCPLGHPYSGDNVAWRLDKYGRWHRRCKECHRKSAYRDKGPSKDEAYQYKATTFDGKPSVVLNACGRCSGTLGLKNEADGVEYRCLHCGAVAMENMA